MGSTKAGDHAGFRVSTNAAVRRSRDKDIYMIYIYLRASITLQGSRACNLKPGLDAPIGPALASGLLP